MDTVSKRARARRDVSTVTITCARDGRAHHVPAHRDVAPCTVGLRSGDLDVRHVVTAAAMVEPEGAPCPLCAAF